MPQPVQTVGIEDQQVSLSANTTGQHSGIIDIQVPAGHQYEYPAGEPLEMFVPAHESVTVSANSTETVDLSHNIVNSPAVRSLPESGGETEVSGQYDLVVWDDNDDIQTDVDSVDYVNNSFEYTNSDGTADNLEVFYLWGDSSQIEFRRYAPDGERFEKELIDSMRTFHSARVFDRQSQITFSEPFTMHEKEVLRVTVKTDVDLANWDVHDSEVGGGPGDFSTYSYADFSVPVRRISMQ